MNGFSEVTISVSDVTVPVSDVTVPVSDVTVPASEISVPVSEMIPAASSLLTETLELDQKEEAIIISFDDDGTKDFTGSGQAAKVVNQVQATQKFDCKECGESSIFNFSYKQL